MKIFKKIALLLVASFACASSSVIAMNHNNDEIDPENVVNGRIRLITRALRFSPEDKEAYRRGDYYEVLKKIVSNLNSECILTRVLNGGVERVQGENKKVPDFFSVAIEFYLPVVDAHIWSMILKNSPGYVKLLTDDLSRVAPSFPDSFNLLVKLIMKIFYSDDIDFLCKNELCHCFDVVFCDAPKYAIACLSCTSPSMEAPKKTGNNKESYNYIMNASKFNGMKLIIAVLHTQESRFLRAAISRLLLRDSPRFMVVDAIDEIEESVKRMKNGDLFKEGREEFSEFASKSFWDQDKESDSVDSIERQYYMVFNLEEYVFDGKNASKTIRFIDGQTVGPLPSILLNMEKR